LPSCCATVNLSFASHGHPASPTLFPYTTLFRSVQFGQDHGPAEGTAVFVANQLRRLGKEVLATPRHAEAVIPPGVEEAAVPLVGDRKSTRLNSSHGSSSYAVFCLKKTKMQTSET